MLSLSTSVIRPRLGKIKNGANTKEVLPRCVRRIGFPKTQSYILRWYNNYCRVHHLVVFSRSLRQHTVETFRYSLCIVRMDKPVCSGTKSSVVQSKADPQTRNHENSSMFQIMDCDRWPDTFYQLPTYDQRRDALWCDREVRCTLRTGGSWVLFSVSVCSPFRCCETLTETKTKCLFGCFADLHVIFSFSIQMEVRI